MRLELRDDEKIAWYWTYLVGVPGIPGIIVVRDHEVPLPRQRLEIRAEGLWAELWCETPGEHWTFGLEAFGIRLDAPEDALRPGGEIGDRVAVGLDLERRWETTRSDRGERSVESTRAGDDSAATGGERSVESTHGVVHGDVLVGRDRFTIEAPGAFYEDDRAPAVDGEVVARVIIPRRGRARARADGHRPGVGLTRVTRMDLDQLDQRQIALGLARARAVNGLAMLLVPGLVARLLFGRHAPGPIVRALVRLVGIRDLVLGVGAINTIKEHTMDAEWVAVGALADLVDGVVALAAPGLPARARARRRRRAVAPAP